MDIASNGAKGAEGEEDRKTSQASEGGACAEDRQGLPTDAVVVAAPAANEKAKRPSRVKKVVMMERTVSTPRLPDIGDDPLFFAKLSVMSKRVEQAARRHRLSALHIA